MYIYIYHVADTTRGVDVLSEELTVICRASLGEIYFHQRWEPDRLIHTYLSTTGWNMFFSNVQTLPADFVAFGGKDTM